jgi:hypothetical protein
MFNKYNRHNHKYKKQYRHKNHKIYKNNNLVLKMLLFNRVKLIIVQHSNHDFEEDCSLNILF